MQLDRPKSRQRSRDQARHEQSQNPTITPQDPFAAPAPPPAPSQPLFQPSTAQADPFQPLQQQHQPHPFGKPPTTFRSNVSLHNRSAFSEAPHAPKQKSFTAPQENPGFARPQTIHHDPYPAQNAFTPPKEKPFFGRPTSQEPWSAQNPFTPPTAKPFNTATQSFPKSKFAKPAAPPFAAFGADEASRFRKPASQGDEASANFASGITFGPTELQADPFARRPSRKPAFGRPVERREKRGAQFSETLPESHAFGVVSENNAPHEPRGKRRSTPRRTRGTRERHSQPTRSDVDADIDLGDDTATEPTKRRAQSRNQLLLTSVPIPLFSRAAIQRHFSSVRSLSVSHVSLRGSRRPDARRSALISFPDERQAALALREANTFRGIPLRLAVYRQAAPEHVEESNELFFNYVPEALFSEQGVTDLFDSISDNDVVRVSLKEKPFYGSVRRTAIITFNSVAAAAKALQNLPLYKGRSLTVSFRRSSPGASNAVPAAPDDGDEAGMPLVKSYASDDRQGYDDGAEEMPSILQRIGKSPHPSKRSNRVVSDEGEDPETDDNLDPESEDDYGEPLISDVGDRQREEDKSVRLKAARMSAEMNRLRAAIEKKQKQRSMMTQSERGKRESKLMVPKRREAPSTQQDASSGWRKVGEKVDIKNAMNFVGTCMTMCSLKEFEDRIIQRDISMFEKDDDREPSFERAVKKYRRSAAISEQPSPDEVRPPAVLLTTMNHLMKICDSVDAKFADVHNFVRDRTRSLRQDFTLQGVRNESCIKIHEESVRFHILSEHRLCGTDPAIFSSKQNREQLDKCLISLREMYDLRRDNDLDTSPNEPEMQAYYMLTQMSDPKTCVQLCTGFSHDVRSSRPIQFALAVVRAASDGFGSFTRYFSLVRSAPYLMACLMHSRFSEVRVRALAVINSTHGNPSSRDTIPISAIRRQLAFENEDETVRFCRTLGMTVENAMIPSNGPEQPAIRTPSSGFDEANKTELKASRADVLIESKAGKLKTSDIIQGKSRNEYMSDDFMKKSSGLLKAKEKKSVVIHSSEPPSLLPKSLQTAAAALANVPKLRTPRFTLEQPGPSTIRFSEGLEKSSHPTEPKLKPLEKRETARGAFTEPEPSSTPSVFPPLQRKKRNLSNPSKELLQFDFTIPAQSRNVLPSNTFRPGEKWTSNHFPSVQKTDLPLESTRFLHTATLESHVDSEKDKPKLASTGETQDEKIRGQGLKRSSKTTAEDDKPSAEKLKIAARLSALKSLLVDLIKSSEIDIQNVRKIIEAVQAGSLRFPKAMEAWDDARDMLLSVSEQSERGLQALKRHGSFDEDGPAEDVKTIVDFREKILFFSQEGAELRDQLDEMFSKSLAAATANLKETGLPPSGTSLTPESVPAGTRGGIVVAYPVDDDDESPFGSRELHDSGSESHNAVTTILTTELPKWQTIIVPLTGESESGIAQRWLRHRFTTNPNIGTGSLSLIDVKETGSVSLSVLEIKRKAAIPCTANLVIFPCDISKTGDDMSSTWAALEQVLRKNRSIALSRNLPPPMVVILYYRGSSDMPSWLTNDESFGSFTSFQLRVQQNGYVATIEKLELPRIPALQGVQSESFTVTMTNGIRRAALNYVKLGAIPLKTNLRDHLVHAANNVLNGVLGTKFSIEDDNTFRQCIYDINLRWSEIAQHLRHEEARWPKEMAVRRRLKDAFTTIESNLRLPVLDIAPSTNEYIRQMGAYVGLAIPVSRPLEGPHWFLLALSHLMDAFVGRKLQNCMVSLVYLSPETGKYVKQPFSNRTLVHTYNPIRPEKREEGLQSRYISRTLLKHGTKRRRDNNTSNSNERLSNPMKRRLSFSSAEPAHEEMEPASAVPSRRRSLPASYGRRRMYEMLDGICRDGQLFDELLRTTMDALISKRRRLENCEGVLA